MKFLADMGVSPAVVEHLRQNGFDAVHLAERGLERLPDDEAVGLARREHRVLLVHDLGFGELLAVSGERLPSVVSFRLRSMAPGSVIQSLDRVLGQHREALEQGAMITVTEHRIRVRRLPLARND